jgi:ATP-dependent DNA helicase RecG
MVVVSHALPTALFDALQFVKGVGPARARALEALGLRTPWDLLMALPKRHYDRGQARKIREVREGASETVQGIVVTTREGRTRTGKTWFALEVEDETGAITAMFWGRRHLEKAFRVGDAVLLTGRVERYRGLQIVPDDFEIVSGEDYEPIHAVGLVPGYGPVESFGRKAYRRLVWHVTSEIAPRAPEYLPAERLAARGLMPEPEALRAAHFPRDAAEKERARERLAYDELFFLQFMLAQRRRGLDALKVGRRLPVPDTLDFRIRARFPFALTAAQERVVADLRRELGGERPMNRLLQGDVGSGKTVVAAYAVLAAVGNRAQAAVMAPTEILAEQHLRTFRRMLAGSRVRLEFLGGGRRTKERTEALARIATGEADVVIGTHAVIEKDVVFKELALAVVDEQQKFGVLQRAALRLKGTRPHVLVMTATPIPRTLAMTLYGDLDVSVIDEMPPGRKPVHTRFVPPSRRPDALRFVKAKLKEGRQAYFVFPLVEESEEPLDAASGGPRGRLKAATTMAEQLSRELAPFRVALLHGRMKPEEKDAVMEEFRAGRVHALASTVVIEVGIDVPNATVMVVSDCERFGLSPLHQLRGRIGRGAHEGHCLLLGDPKSDEARARIEALVSTSDGFRIAEADLRLRGPGELAGTRQSGLPEFRAADLVRDVKLLGWAREDASALVGRETPILREYLARRMARVPAGVVG